MIREADESDIGQLVGFADRYIETSKLARLVAPSREEIRDGILNLIVNGVMLVADTEGHIRGLLGGLLSHLPYSKAPLACVVYWWVEPEKRSSPLGVRLLEWFEDWGKARGAEMVTISDMADDEPRALYCRLGYDLAERSYYKQV